MADVIGADVRSWRRRKPGSHTREITREVVGMPDEVRDLLAAMVEQINTLKADNHDLQQRVDRVEGFLALVNAEYQARKAAA